MSKKVGKYELGRTLGEGTFGKVKHAIHQDTNEAVAIKVLDKEKIQKQNMGAQIKKEISIMKMVRHKYVVGMKEVLASKTKIFIVLELVTGGELFDKIVSEGKLAEEPALYYFRQLVEGVEYCHGMGVCHRDLKPENLLLDANGNLKISDFGLSSLYVGDEDSDGATRTKLLHTTCGTPNYVAPEVLADQGYDGKKADVWSIGVVLYVLLAGFLPFDEPTIVALFAKIQNADFTYPSWFGSSVRDLLDSIFVADAELRITLTDVRNHPFVYVEGQESTPVNTIDLSDLALSGDGGKDNDDTTDVPDGIDSSSNLNKKSSWRTTTSKGNKVLNAFDLVNISGGFALDRLFIPGDEAHVSTGAATGRRHAGLQFTSSEDPANLTKAIGAAMSEMDMEIEVEQVGAKVKATKLTPKGMIGITVYVYVLTQNLSLIEFKRGKGDLLEFRNTYMDLEENKISHLLRRQ